MKYGYLRVSTDKQDEENQKLEIGERECIDEWIAVECSSRCSQDERGVTGLLHRLQYGDTVVVTELSRLARSTSELLLMVEGFIKEGVGLIALKQGIRIPANGERMDASTKTIVTMFGLMAELERDFISMRTKMALSAKRAQGVKLGKPKGTIQPSKLDVHRETIEKMVKAGASMNFIAGAVGFSRCAVKNYVESRKIKEAP